MFFVCLVVAFVLGSPDRACAQDQYVISTMQRVYGNMFMLNVGGQFGLAQGGANFGGGTTGLPSGFRGQSYEADEVSDVVMLDNQWQLWGGAAYTYMNAQGYTDKSQTHQGYRVHRPGFMGGIRRAFSDTASGGIMLAFTSPEFRQVGTYEDYNNINWTGVTSRVDVDVKDFQFALHFDKRFWDDWELTLFAGGGAQWMHWNRMMQDIGKYNYSANATGNTFTGVIYLARCFDITSQTKLRGLIGLESEHSWTFGFAESGPAIAEAYMSNSDMSGAFQAYRSGKISYSRNTVRAGLRWSHESQVWRMGSSLQILYGYAMGAEAATVSVSSVKVNEALEDYIVIGNIKGYAVGRHSLTLGGNLHCFLDEAQTFALQMDYTAVLYENLTTQNVALTLAKQY